MSTHSSGGWLAGTRLRLHHVYYLLAAFDLLTVCLGLFLINRVIEIYDESVAVNLVWAERLNDFSRLGELAAGVNAPGNDVFDSRDVEAESARLAQAVEAYGTRAAAVRRDLERDLTAPERAALLGAFEHAEPAMRQMVAEARQIFDRFRAGEPERAGEHMAAMDQEFAKVNAALARAGRLVRDVQRAHFGEQTAAAASLRRLEFVIAGCIVVMVAGVTFYGHTLARRMRQAQAERQQAADELERHRDHLEDLVAERTRELEATHERLRLAERLASIGTLAAGLGHDMNNVLFPVRCRLDVLDAAGIEGPARAELAGVRHSIDYLQQLADGLRLLALDPDDPRIAGGVTHLDRWAQEIRPLVQTALPRGSGLVVDVPEGLPPVAIPAHRLTQAAFNLVVNAGEAADGKGTVRLWARAAAGGKAVQVGVSDDGQGMTSEVKRRALDPFFTTKKRGLSTGLGLALVSGVAKSAGGRVDIQSAPGRGTTVILELPAACRAGAPAGDGSPLAALSIGNPHTAAVLGALLRSEGFDVRAGDGAPPEEAVLWVTEPPGDSIDAARRYLDRSPRRSLIVYGGAVPELERLGAAAIREADGLEAIRLAFRRAAARVAAP
jgi:signal transduction histidine kinase